MSLAIDFVLSDGVAVVTINRPERLNAMDAEHYSALSQAWTKVRDNPDIRVAVVTGAARTEVIESSVRAVPASVERIPHDLERVAHRDISPCAM